MTVFFFVLPMFLATYFKSEYSVFVHIFFVFKSTFSLIHLLCFHCISACTRTHLHNLLMVRLPDRVIIGLVTWGSVYVCVCERRVIAMRDLPLSKTRSGDNLIIKDLFFSRLPLSLPFHQLADNARNVTHCHHLACVCVCEWVGDFVFKCVFCGFPCFCAAIAPLLYCGIESVKVENLPLFLGV